MAIKIYKSETHIDWNAKGVGVLVKGTSSVPVESVKPLTYKTIVEFTATATPTLADYQTNYSYLYGEYPTVILRTIDGDGNYIDRKEQAKFNMSGGLITSISWDLPEAETGYIIIY
jgi:hypothetical protein